MKSLTQYLTVNVSARMGFVNITSQCEELVRKSGIQEGLLLANAQLLCDIVHRAVCE